MFYKLARELGSPPAQTARDTVTGSPAGSAILSYVQRPSGKGIDPPGTAPPREAAVARCPESLGQCGCGSCSKGPFSETDLCPGAGALVPHTHPSLPFFTSHLCFWPFDRCLQLSCIRHVAIPRLSLLVYRMGGIYSCLKFRSRGLGQPSHSDSPILPQCSLPPNC